MRSLGNTKGPWEDIVKQKLSYEYDSLIKSPRGFLSSTLYLDKYLGRAIWLKRMRRYLLRPLLCFISLRFQSADTWPGIQALQPSEPQLHSAIYNDYLPRDSYNKLI